MKCAAYLEIMEGKVMNHTVKNICFSVVFILNTISASATQEKIADLKEQYLKGFESNGQRVDGFTKFVISHQAQLIRALKILDTRKLNDDEMISIADGFLKVLYGYCDSDRERVTFESVSKVPREIAQTLNLRLAVEKDRKTIYNIASVISEYDTLAKEYSEKSQRTASYRCDDLGDVNYVSVEDGGDTIRYDNRNSGAL